jgi:hypothetical protein
MKIHQANQILLQTNNNNKNETLNYSECFSIHEYMKMPKRTEYCKQYNGVILSLPQNYSLHN